MRRTVLYIAASLDGFIADKSHGLDWLTSYSGNYGYNEFLTTVDVAISGRKTYDAVVAMGVKDPYPGIDYYILTSAPEQFASSEKIIYTKRSPRELIGALKEQKGKNIYLVGGGKLISEFLEHDLIDDIILFIVPVILGGGIPLFPGVSHPVRFATESAKQYPDGMIELRLKRA